MGNMYYELFEQGVCDSLSLQPSQISKEARELLKQAYASAYTGEAPQQTPQQSNTLSMKNIGVGLGAAAGLYGVGKYSPEGALGGFAKGVDNWVQPAIQGVKNQFAPSIKDEAIGMNSRITDGSVNGMLSGVKTPSQLQGTQLYQPGKGEQIADTAASTVGTADIAGLGARGVIGATKMVAPQLTAQVGSTAAGQAAGKGLAMTSAAIAGGRVGGRFIPGLSTLMTVPDGLQLGDKASDALGIQNKWGRRAVQAGTVAGSMGTAAGGAMAGAAIGSVVPVIGTAIGGVAGGLIGGLAPGMLNGALNRRNELTMNNNQTAGHLAAANTEFQNAMTQKAQGNNNPINAWYGMQTPESLKTNIALNKGNGALQDQMHLNNPNRAL